MVIEGGEAEVDVVEVEARQAVVAPVTAALSTRTYRLETGPGAPCTSSTDDLHISVQLHLLAPGRIFTSRNLKKISKISNENLTSSV